MEPKFKRIDKYYWLNKGYEMVEGGLNRVHKQIASVNTYINGLLGIYVLATVIDAIYMEIDTPLKLVIVLAPVLIVKIAMFHGKISVIPEAKSFFPDSAESSEATYYQFLRDARLHLKEMKKFAAWSTGILLLVLSVVTYWTVESKQNNENEKRELKKTKKELAITKTSLDSIRELDIYYVNSKVLQKEGMLLLEGSLPKNNSIELNLLGLKDSKILSEYILIGNSGSFNHSISYGNYKKTSDTLVLKIRYKISNTEDRILQKIVSLKTKE